MLSLTNYVVEFFGIKHISKNSAAVKVIFLSDIWAEFLN